MQSVKQKDRTSGQNVTATNSMQELLEKFQSFKSTTQAAIASPLRVGWERRVLQPASIIFPGSLDLFARNNRHKGSSDSWFTGMERGLSSFRNEISKSSLWRPVHESAILSSSLGVVGPG
mmetsp:Transcript_18310/g.30082  ORF Transcript_18310/g.30082 Transcript_18310/m.30082 type:complete len:120 (-) Transcript_18310:56-415(-)